ncbi:MAG: hypothetical protein R3D55_28600 [Chloroflexota bacterium]
MIRSRFLFILLFLAYLGVTPAGVYTCACLVTAEPIGQQIDFGEISEQVSVTETAVATLLSFFSLSFAMVLAFMLHKRQELRCCFLFEWHPPVLFSEPPPTPPPHLA